MKIIIITQNDPFFLNENIKYLYKNLQKSITIEGIILYEPSPFGKKLSFFEKAKQTISIFGINFFIFYSLRFAVTKLRKKYNLKNTIKDLGIKVIDLEKSINHLDSLEKIKSYKPDLLVSILGSEIFKKNLINLTRYGCINLHSSLLPKYRGLMPTFWALKNKERFTGVSVFFVDEGIDSGQIIIQKKFRIDNISHFELIKKTKELGIKAIIEAIHKINKNNFQLIDNNDDNKTYFSFPTRKDVKQFIKAGNTFF